MANEQLGERAQRWIAFTVMHVLFLAVGLISLLVVTKRVAAIPAFEAATTPLLFGSIAGNVVTFFVQAFLRQKPPIRIYINLTFCQKQANEVDLDMDRCTYIVCEDGKTIADGCLTIEKGKGNWRCSFPLDSKVQDHAVAKLTLVDTAGVRWKVATFSPRTLSLEAEAP